MEILTDGLRLRAGETELQGANLQLQTLSYFCKDYHVFLTATHRRPQAFFFLRL